MGERGLPSPQKARVLGRYVAYDEIAAGGMATVSFGRILGAAGFARTVAIKRLHPHLAREQAFVRMFVDEARLASRIRHANVVPTLDIVSDDSEVWLVMEYVHGESLSNLARAAEGATVPLEIALHLIGGALRGLHAAHEARSEDGSPLGLVHRDVSPQNILVGADGVARVLDFGVAKAAVRLHSTGDGSLKGKLRYMAFEQLATGDVDRRTDVYSASVVLWEILAGRPLRASGEPAGVVREILGGDVPRLSGMDRGVPREVDDIVRRGLSSDPDHRYRTALEMAEALERSHAMATAGEAGSWVERIAAPRLAARAAKLAEIERAPRLVVDDGAASVPRVLHDDTTGAGASIARDPTVVGDPSRTTSRGAFRRMLLLGCGVLALAVAGLGARSRLRAGTHADVTAADGVSSPAPEPSTSVVAPAAPAPTTSAAASAPSHAIDVARIAAPIDSDGKNAPAQSGVRRAARPALKKAACNPPYTIEPNGTKRFLTECL